jgi:hypothetical protein
MIKRQMYGRAGFALLRHRILLGLRTVTTGSETEPLFLQSRTELVFRRSGCRESNPHYQLGKSVAL